MSTPPYTRINLTQQTDEWRQWRRSVVGASDAPVIMGESKWKSIDTLLKEKLGELPEFAGNSQTRQGNQLEPVARSHFEARAKVLTPPAVVVSTTRPWQAASLDGLSGNGSHVVEIKCGKRAYEITADSGVVPTYYYGQLQHILAVTGLPVIHYCCYWPGHSPLILQVGRNDAYIDQLLVAEFQFWQRVSSGSRARSADRSKTPIQSSSKVATTHGTLRFSDGGTYIGWHVGGVPNGEGTRTYANGVVHTGGFRNGNAFGPGKSVLNGEFELEGSWGEDGLLSGPGRCIFSSGDSYVGQFKAGLRQGKGLYKGVNGYQYEGEWVSNQQTGIGTETRPNGTTYHGQFFDGKYHGRGTYKDDQILYDGEFARGVSAGKGTATFLELKFVATGEWHDFDLISGRITYPNGDFYEGELDQWRPHGQGTLQLSTGESYTGDWKDGDPQPQGVLSISITSSLYLGSLKAILDLENFLQTAWVRYEKRKPSDKTKRAIFLRQFERLIANAERAKDDTENVHTFWGYDDNDCLDNRKTRRNILVSHAFSRLNTRAAGIVQVASTKFKSALEEFTDEYGRKIWEVAPDRR